MKEALKLASALDHWATQTDMGRKPDPRSLPRKASAELRRLHREIERIKAAQPAPVQESVAWFENLKRLASIFPELNMANYSDEDVDDLNCWAIEVANCIYGIATPPAAPVQDGWILVPVTLTNDMTSAMADALEDPNNERSSWDLAENMWRAMLTKAPTPPAAQPAQPAQEQESVAWAKFLHYPECWDTAAYPTLHDAIHEALAWAGCSVCARPAAQRKPLTDEQKKNIVENWFAEEWAIKKAIGMLEDYEAAHNIKEQPWA
jgi:hypothetical protein